MGICSLFGKVGKTFLWFFALVGVVTVVSTSIHVLRNAARQRRVYKTIRRELNEIDPGLTLASPSTEGSISLDEQVRIEGAIDAMTQQATNIPPAPHNQIHLSLKKLINSGQYEEAMALLVELPDEAMRTRWQERIAISKSLRGRRGHPLEASVNERTGSKAGGVTH